MLINFFHGLFLLLIFSVVVLYEVSVVVKAVEGFVRVL